MVNNEVQRCRESANIYRKMADVLDKLADNMEDEEITTKERSEKSEALMAEIVVLAMKADRI